MLLPQLDVSTYSSQLFWLTINIFIIYLVVSRVFVPAMSKKLNYRKQITDTLTQETLQLHQQAKQLDEAANLLIVEAYKLSAKLQTQAIEELDTQKKQNQLKLAKELEEMEQRADQELTQILEDLAANINGIAASHASTIIKQFTGYIPDLRKTNQVAQNIN